MAGSVVWRYTARDRVHDCYFGNDDEGRHLVAFVCNAAGSAGTDPPWGAYFIESSLLLHDRADFPSVEAAKQFVEALIALER